MNPFFIKKTLKLAVLAGLLAVLVTLSAPASVSYSFAYPDSGAIPQAGTTYSAQQTLSGLGGPITGVQLVLTFNDSASLPISGAAGTIQGLLTLGTLTTSPYVNFTPVDNSGAGLHTYTSTTFSGLNGYDPNTTWGLVLWDTSSTGFENGLVGWTLDITVVPEPVTYALAGFGLILVGSGAGRIFWQRRHKKA